MPVLPDKEKCCGCTACQNICVHNAITMVPDNMGFKYPRINKSACIDCGLCIKVCAFNNRYGTDRNFTQPKVYAVRHKNEREMETSRSGGAFIAFSDFVLKQGGVIYGAGYTDHFRITHKRAVTKQERNEFKGSKYVQSDLNTVFLQIKADLNNGLKVLFSGTPCQTAGLKSYIGENKSDNLYLIDIICHGTPSPYLWRDYLKYTEQKYNQKIIHVNFRDKSLGWTAHKESFIFENGRKIITDIWEKLFYQHIMLRPSCGNCPYTNINRPSDITLGDFWGWEKTDTAFNSDNKGCSLVLINTNKGERLFSASCNDFTYVESDISRCMQPNLQKPTLLSDSSEEFVRNYSEGGFETVIARYGTVRKKCVFVNFTKRALNRLRQIFKHAKPL